MARSAPAAVFQPAGQEVARGGSLLGEGEAADLAPVDLEILGRESLEADRDVGHGLRMRHFPPDATHQIVEDSAPSGVGPLRIAACNFEDANIRQTHLDALLDLEAMGICPRGAPAWCWWLVDWLMQDAGNGGRTTTQFCRDLANALAALGQELHRAAFHLP